MKRLLFPLWFLIVGAVLVVAGGCSRPLTPTEAADAFFANVARGHFQQAYDSAAFAFQAGESFQSFQATAKDAGLAGGTGEVSWTRTRVAQKEAKLEGRVTGAEGKITVAVTLIHERGRWRLFSLNTPENPGSANFAGNRFTLVGKGAAFSSVANRPVPSEQVCRQLVEQSLVMFNDAVQRHTFSDFFSGISYSWQQQVTLHQLQTAFQPFIDAKINLGPLRRYAPVFDETPQVNSDGVLILNGHYPPQPFTVYFSLRFTYEMPNWKLLGIDVRLMK